MSNQDLQAMSIQLQQTMMWMSQIMQQRSLTPPVAVNPTPITTPSQIPRPTFITEIKNHDQATTVLLTRKEGKANLSGSLQLNPGAVQ